MGVPVLTPVLLLHPWSVQLLPGLLPRGCLKHLQKRWDLPVGAQRHKFESNSLSTFFTVILHSQPHFLGLTIFISFSLTRFFFPLDLLVAALTSVLIHRRWSVRFLLWLLS